MVKKYVVGYPKEVKSLTRQKKFIMWTVWAVSLLQMIGSATAPAMNIMKTTVFAQYPLAQLQTVMALTGLVSPVISLTSAELIRRGLLRKKTVVVTGLVTLGLTGLLALVLHGALWQLGLLSVLTGVASGCYLSTVLSIMVDKFEPRERQVVTGLQSVFVNGGGFLISVLGGLLASWHWYGGYLILIAGLPVGLLAVLTLPKEAPVKKGATGQQGGRSRFDRAIFFYAVAVLAFMLLFGSINQNLAIHMAAAGFENPALVGVITSIQMAGGVVFGFVFPKLTRRMGDWILLLAFLLVAVGLTLMNVGHSSLLVNGLGVFLAGASLSLIGPHCVVAVSGCVDCNTSALATSLITGLAPGLGSFLSPVLFTPLTTWLGGPSTNYRYQFIAIVGLVCALGLAAYLGARQKNRSRVAVLEQQ